MKKKTPASKRVKLDGSDPVLHQDESTRYYWKERDSGARTSSGKALIEHQSHSAETDRRPIKTNNDAAFHGLTTGRRVVNINIPASKGKLVETHEAFSPQDHRDAASYYKKHGATKAERAHAEAAKYLEKVGKSGPSEHVKGLTLSKDLDEQQKHAIRQYVHKDSHFLAGHNDAINASLRGIKGYHSSASTKKWGDHINNAIHQSAADKPITLYRGVTSGHHFGDIKEGHTLEMKGVTSTSTKKSTAAHYASTSSMIGTKPSNMVFHINVPKGGHALSIDEHSHVLGEKEVLLAHNSKYHVDKIEHGRSGKIVHLTQHPNGVSVKKSMASFGSYQCLFQHFAKAKGPLDHSGVPPADPRHAWPLGSKRNPSSEDRETARIAHMDATGEAYAGRHTPEERHALRGYTREASAAHPHGDYHAINDHLDGTSQAPVEHQAKSAQSAALINQAISHSKLHMNMTLHRSGHLPADLKEGDVISSPRLTSTSYSPLAAKRFKSDHPNHAMIKIKAKKGDNAYNYSMHDNSDHEESEILFGSHQKFHVHKIKTDAKGRRSVTLGTSPAKIKQAVVKPELAKADAPTNPISWPANRPETERFYRRVSDHGQFKIIHRPLPPRRNPVKKAESSFGSYQCLFQHFAKAKGPLDHGGVPSADPRHIAPLGSKINPSHEQRTLGKKKLRRRGGNSNVGYFTAKERHALSNYTKQATETSNSGHYMAVNSVLAGNKRSTKKETDQARHAGMLVNQAISHAKLHKNMKLHRSGNLPMDIKEGSVVSSPRLTSTAASKFVSDRFKNEHDPENASMVVKARKGDPAFHFNNHGLSSHKNESEVLFGSHQKFHVHDVKVHKKTGHRTVTLATYPKRARNAEGIAPSAELKPAVGDGLTKSEDARTQVCPHFARRISGDNGFVKRLNSRYRGQYNAKALPGGNPVKKAESSFGSYQDAFQKLHDLSAAANNASSGDQHYAWSQYQKLFDLNHRNMEALEQLAAMRQLAMQR